jgi:hypothetical protein
MKGLLLKRFTLCNFYLWGEVVDTTAYLRHAATEICKHGDYTRLRKAVFSPCRAVPSSTRQRCGKYISAAANQRGVGQRLCRRDYYVTVEQAVFSACPCEGL